MSTIIDLKHALKYLILIGGIFRVVILFIQIKIDLAEGSDIIPVKKRIRNTIYFVIISQVLFNLDIIIKSYFK